MLKELFNIFQKQKPQNHLQYIRFVGCSQYPNYLFINGPLPFARSKYGRYKEGLL